MYKHITLPELKKFFKLPPSFRVDACIVYGSYDEAKYKKEFLSLLKGKKVVIDELKDDFINKILSVKVGNKRIWFIVEYGGARLSEFVHFASMLGSKVNILTGSCGGLKKGLDEFAIVIPSYSYSTESSCHMYLRDKKDNRFYPDKKLSEEVINLLKDKQKVVSGPIITCQAMMGETWEDIQKWSKAGFYGVEREASTVFSVSEHFKVPSTAILRVADNLIEKEIVRSESYKKKKDKFDEIKDDILRTALDIALEK
jgi:purine-nucleoside phosphorylase